MIDNPILKLDVGKGFYVVNLKGLTAEQLFSFLSPIIEYAGFKWEIEEDTLRFYKEQQI